MYESGVFCDCVVTPMCSMILYDNHGRQTVEFFSSVLYSWYASGPCDLEEAIESRICLSQRDGHNVAG